MDKPDFEQLKQYLKENLSLDADLDRGYYGMPDNVKVSLLLEGEKISETYIPLPDPR